MISWDNYFIEIAKTISSKSKDPHTKVGAVLVDNENRIIGTGYNGFPPGFSDTEERWQRPTKYSYVVHAEANCLLHSIVKPKGHTMYTTMFPCQECAKLLATSGVKKIVYLDDKYKNDVADTIFKEMGILIYKCLDSK